MLIAPFPSLPWRCAFYSLCALTLSTSPGRPQGPRLSCTCLDTPYPIYIIYIYMCGLVFCSICGISCGYCRALNRFTQHQYHHDEEHDEDHDAVTGLPHGQGRAGQGRGGRQHPSIKSYIPYPRPYEACFPVGSCYGRTSYALGRPRIACLIVYGRPIVHAPINVTFFADLVPHCQSAFAFLRGPFGLGFFSMAMVSSREVLLLAPIRYKAKGNRTSAYKVQDLSHEISSMY